MDSSRNDKSTKIKCSGAIFIFPYHVLSLLHHWELSHLQLLCIISYVLYVFRNIFLKFLFNFSNKKKNIFSGIKNMQKKRKEEKRKKPCAYRGVQMHLKWIIASEQGGTQCTGESAVRTSRPLFRYFAFFHASSRSRTVRPAHAARLGRFCTSFERFDRSDRRARRRGKRKSEKERKEEK